MKNPDQIIQKLADLFGMTLHIQLPNMFIKTNPLSSSPSESVYWAVKESRAEAIFCSGKKKKKTNFITKREEHYV